MGWYSDVKWEYYTLEGDIEVEIGVYLICDNGYLRWSASICPHLHSDKTTMEGYFSTHLESVPKDVECVFGNLKKSWRVLDHGFNIFLGDMQKGIYNKILDMMESRSNQYCVGRGLEVIGQGMWLVDGEDNIPFALEVDNKITYSK